MTTQPQTFLDPTLPVGVRVALRNDVNSAGTVKALAGDLVDIEWDDAPAGEVDTQFIGALYRLPPRRKLHPLMDAAAPTMPEEVDTTPIVVKSLLNGNEFGDREDSTGVIVTHTEIESWLVESGC